MMKKNQFWQYLVGSIAILAVFHGYAHGAEMPETASGLTYGIGFIISTAALNLTGIGMGLGIDRFQPKFKNCYFVAAAVSL
jgi:hydrogenase/urease accessory protein HupE